MKLTDEQIHAFAEILCREEKSTATQEKYLRDVRAFCVYLGGKEMTKEQAISWKQHLIQQGYSVRSINSMLASVNSLLVFVGLSHCKVKNIRIQRQTYCAEDKELNKTEYLRLIDSAKQKGNERLNLILQTICGTGIPVSELQFITVEAVRYGEITVDCKNKTRQVFLPGKLRNILLNHTTFPSRPPYLYHDHRHQTPPQN